MLGVKQGPEKDIVFPRSLTDNVVARFKEQHAGRDLMDAVLPSIGAEPKGTLVNPVDVLDRVLQVDDQMLRLTRDIIGGPSKPQVVMLHVTAFDNICHAFWPYRFPEDFFDTPPDSEDVERLGPVIDNYLVLLDRNISTLISSFATLPNVVIVSDHGEGRNFTASSLWPGWHESPGIFIAAGPDVAHESTMLDVSYYDIVPTLLGLEGVKLKTTLRGHIPIGIRAAPNYPPVHR
jgi:hypothetical protein